MCRIESGPRRRAEVEVECRQRRRLQTTRDFAPRGSGSGAGMAEQGRTGGPEEGELFRLLAENVRDCAVFAVDPNGLIRNWNGGAQRLFGYREEEIVGQPATDLFAPEDAAAGTLQHELRQAAEAGRCEADRWHARKDGSRFWANTVTTPLWDAAR